MESPSASSVPARPRMVCTPAALSASSDQESSSPLSVLSDVLTKQHASPSASAMRHLKELHAQLAALQHDVQPRDTSTKLGNALKTVEELSRQVDELHQKSVVWQRELNALLEDRIRVPGACSTEWCGLETTGHPTAADAAEPDGRKAETGAAPAPGDAPAPTTAAMPEVASILAALPASSEAQLMAEVQHETGMLHSPAVAWQPPVRSRDPAMLDHALAAVAMVAKADSAATRAECCAASARTEEATKAARHADDTTCGAVGAAPGHQRQLPETRVPGKAAKVSAFASAAARLAASAFSGTRVAASIGEYPDRVASPPAKARQALMAHSNLRGAGMPTAAGAVAHGSCTTVTTQDEGNDQLENWAAGRLKALAESEAESECEVACNDDRLGNGRDPALGPRVHALTESSDEPRVVGNLLPVATDRLEKACQAAAVATEERLEVASQTELGTPSTATVASQVAIGVSEAGSQTMHQSSMACDQSTQVRSSATIREHAAHVSSSAPWPNAPVPL
jgi:hypothetical protein